MQEERAFIREEKTGYYEIDNSRQGTQEDFSKGKTDAKI